jgi:hypothetical protein
MMEAKGYVSIKAGVPTQFATDKFSLRLHEPDHAEPSEQESVEMRTAPSSRVPVPARSEVRTRRLATDIVAAVQSRLPGRIRDLKVRIDGDQFVLSGVSSSYYVKQMAQHIAMTALDAVTLGQLINEIEVRAPR